MSFALLANPLVASPAKSSFRRTSRNGTSALRASYRPGPSFNGFDAGKAFQQAAEQFAQFQKQQAQQQSQSARRSTAGRTDAFRSRGPFSWSLEPEQVNNFLREMDRAFGGDGSDVPSVENMEEAASRLYFPVDIRESSTEYKYIIDLPGVPKADIKVTVDQDRKLSIKGERKKAELGEGWKQKKQERRFGPFHRKFQLPEDADVKKIAGKSENGSLTITIQKVPKEEEPDNSTTVPIY